MPQLPTKARHADERLRRDQRRRALRCRGDERSLQPDANSSSRLPGSLHRRAHALTTAGTDALLKETEEPSFQSVFSSPRRARLVSLRHCAHAAAGSCACVSRAERPLALLVSRCEAQGLDLAACEEVALARIAHQAGSNYRTLDDEFERVLSVLGGGALTLRRYVKRVRCKTSTTVCSALSTCLMATSRPLTP